jgi:hypothetical protein
VGACFPPLIKDRQIKDYGGGLKLDSIANCELRIANCLVKVRSEKSWKKQDSLHRHARYHNADLFGKEAVLFLPGLMLRQALYTPAFFNRWGQASKLTKILQSQSPGAKTSGIFSRLL